MGRGKRVRVCGEGAAEEGGGAEWENGATMSAVLKWWKCCWNVVWAGKAAGFLEGHRCTEG